MRIEFRHCIYVKNHGENGHVVIAQGDRHVGLLGRVLLERAGRVFQVERPAAGRVARDLVLDDALDFFDEHRALVLDGLAHRREHNL